MKQAIIRKAVSLGIMTTIGMALITVGVGLINEGEYVAGGILCGLGAIVLIIAEYVRW